VAIPVWLVSQLDHRRIDIKEGQKIQDDGSINYQQISMLHIFIDLRQDQDYGREHCLDQHRYIRRAPARMQLAKEGGQVAVNSDHKRDARSPGDSAAYSAGISYAHQERCNHSEKSDAQNGGTRSDGLEDS